jgi:beta-glucanase (GH16 family)
MKDPARAGTKCAAVDVDGTPLGDYDWRLNGHISTEEEVSFRYGFAAARIKFQPLRGQHGAFWMKPENSELVFNNPDNFNNPKRSGAEIDVTEWFGNDHPSGGLTNYAYYKGLEGATVKVGSWLKDPSRFLSGPDDSWSSNFHVFSVEWTPDSYTFRIDGKQTFRTHKGVSGQPEFLILSLLSSDYELQYLEGDRLPQTMEVDWVRVWEQL